MTIGTNAWITAVKCIHKATAMAFKACAAASVIMRTAIVLGRKMAQLIPENKRLLEGANRFL